jgi:hypothetical protein
MGTKMGGTRRRFRISLADAVGSDDHVLEHKAVVAERLRIRVGEEVGRQLWPDLLLELQDPVRRPR